MTSDIRSTVRNAVREHAKLSDTTELTDSDNLFYRGLTSLASVNLMLALEDALDVEFPDTMLQRSVFESVDSLTTALESLLGQAA